MFITMTKLTRWGGSAAAVALATSMIVASGGQAFAAASTPTFSGGATFPEVIYRTIFDCYADNGSSGELGPVPAACAAAGYPIRTDLQMLYAGVGSGNGKKAFSRYDSSQLTSGSRTPGGPDCIVRPYSGDFGPFFNDSGAPGGQPADGEQSCADGTFRGAGPEFTAYHFTGSDDPMVQGDLDQYHGVSGAHVGDDFSAKYGEPKQVPTLIGGVAVAFNPPAGTFNPVGKKAGGGTNKFDLSRESYCGIFAGKITDWNDAHLTADNKGVSLTGGASKPIEVVVRGDGSGTTFLFTNGLIHQCGSASHPGLGIDPAMTFDNQWMADNGIGDPTDPATQSNNNFFINVNTAGHLPANITLKNGNGGIQQYMDDSTTGPGTIGYLSGDFVPPAATGNDGAGNPIVVQGANVQQWYDVAVNGFTHAGQGTLWVFPRAQSVSKIPVGANPPSFSTATCAGLPEGCATDPLAWGKAFPFPTAKAAYPLGGFTFAEFYGCYASPTDADALFGQTAGNLGFWRWYYGSGAENLKLPKTLLANNSFGVLPGKWRGAVAKLLFKNASTKIDVIGNGNCAGVTPGAGS
jgi:ABC-type phosphate transport system substrate-binding protein